MKTDIEGNTTTHLKKKSSRMNWIGRELNLTAGDAGYPCLKILEYDTHIKHTCKETV